MKKRTIIKKFIILSLGLLVLSAFLSGCGAPKQYTVMKSIMAPRPGDAAAAAAEQQEKKDLFKGLGEPLKIAEATSSSKSDHKSGEAGSGPGPEMTIDGIGGTRWASAYEDEQWLLLDLGAPKKISTVIIKWEVACARKMSVLVSNDKSNWTEVYSGGGRGSKRHDFEPVEARYVKLDLIKRATDWGFSIWDIFVYEAGAQ
ncbi:MAG: discoidin domain-containing protein [bacterium]